MTDGAAGEAEVPTRPDPGSLPWRRNPFVIAFVAGVITITWLHFRLRNIPDPPPAFGPVAAEGWTATGDVVADDPFGGRVTVVAFADPVTRRSCGGVRLANKLRAMFQASDVPVEVAVVAFGGPADEKDGAYFEARLGGPSPGVWAGGPSTEAGVAALSDAVVQALEPATEWRDAHPRRPAPVEQAAAPTCDGHAALSLVAIVDGHAQLRGLYDAWGWEMDSEVFHRAQRVLAVR